MSVSDFALPSTVQRVVNVTWLDVNTRLGEGFKADLLPEVQAINNSLHNLFRCPIGARGPIFQPEYGSLLMMLLHEPLDLITSNKIRMILIQASQRWEPRIKVVLGRTTVYPDYARAGFVATVGYDVITSKEQGAANFLFSQSSISN